MNFVVSIRDVPWLARGVIVRFIKGNGPVYAAAIAFDLLFAAIPFLFLVFAAVSAFVGRDELPFLQLSDVMRSTFPYGAQVMVPNLKTLMESGVTFGVVGIFLLLISSFSVVATVFLALGSAIGTGSRKGMLKGFWFHVLTLLVFILVTGAVVLAPHMLEALALLTKRMPPFMGSMLYATMHGLSNLLFTGFILAGSLASYLFLSPKKPRLANAVPASFLFTTSVFGINWVFLSGVKRLARLSVLYGSIFGVICFIYMAFLLSASYLICGCLIGSLEDLAERKAAEGTSVSHTAG